MEPDPDEESFDLPAIPDIPPGILKQAALDLRHMGRPSLYDRLTEKQRDLVYDLRRNHTERVVIEVIKLPRPVGLNIKISRAALQRFCDRYEETLPDRERDESLKLVTAALENKTDPAAFQKLTATEVKQRLYLASRDEDADPKALNDLITCLLKLQKL